MSPARFILYLINVVFSLIELLIAVRIILRLFGANPAAGFVQWIYATTEPLLRPFIGMFPSPVLEGGFVIEFSAVFALIVYAFVGYLLSEIVAELSYQSRRRVVYTD
ncbi:MAG TPA: YggT family protein [Patescibacteria group bacterium]